MRLTCPNCGAQYEVPDEVIPETGRDVQCSNCGDTWFQTHPNYPDAVAPDLEEFEEDEADWEDAPEDAYDEPLEEEEFEEPAASRSGLNPNIAGVLREEAKREQAARDAEARGGLETQPDLGLSEAEEVDRRTAQAKARMARLRGEAVEDDFSSFEDEQEIPPASRRDFLPEVQDIDQTIDDGGEKVETNASARDGARVDTQPKSSGFGRGFRYAIVLALVATAAYIFAPQFSGMVPALEAPLTDYVAMVDEGRLALNQQFGGIVTQIRAMIGG